MTTLIAVYGHDGCEGRCDARCYNAKLPNCDCICGGRNHGAGLHQAVKNTQELAESWIDEARKRGQDVERFEVPAKGIDADAITHQPSLFGEEAK